MRRSDLDAENYRLTLEACREYLAGDSWLYPGATVTIDGLRVHVTPARDRVRRELLRQIGELLRIAEEESVEEEKPKKRGRPIVLRAVQGGGAG